MIGTQNKTVVEYWKEKAGMALFEQGDFTLHSGGKSKYRINCERLTDGDIEMVAARLAETLPPFHGVQGIPQGGLRLAKALEAYIVKGADSFVIADDVWTTGASMAALRKMIEDDHQFVWGVVIFRRGLNNECPSWVFPFADIDI